MTERGQIKAVLGPTNTGKTHYALERMLAYQTGVIGLPLRLLAREVYDRLVAARGPSVVALVTGEERIVPPRAAYWVCTVEAMPEGIGADFVAIDEIQLCADPERGHVFTQRLLHSRGLKETIFIGADTMRGTINALVPGVEHHRRERFSTLEYRGPKKISRMPERSAIVAFSVDNVYSIAELIRRQKGGAAVVMGALSPRTRNAQVAMYQEGDVDYLVATDAIGMGLNLDINHVAFAGLSKFDGRRMRSLMPNELGQIAGRAGRYKTDGSFGVTGEASPLDPEVVNAIENHHFSPLKRLQWRNNRLDFGSIEALVASLELSSDDPVLVKTRPAEDHRTLQNVSDMAEVAARATDGASVKLLWETCRIPDFTQISANEHATLVSRIFNFLHERGQISEDWFAQKIAQIDKPQGEIDTLSKRLAYIRTWTYVAQRKGWVANESYWREETRQVEDRLSDALHTALTQRFVDRRTSVLMRRLKQKERLVAEITKEGDVTVEGQFVGKLSGFRFQMDSKASPEEAKTLRAAALAALTPEFHLRSDRMYNAPDTEFEITDQGGLMWGEHAVGKLRAGDDLMAPKIDVFVDDEAGSAIAEKVERRLGHFLERKIAAAFEALIALRDDAEMTGLARGFAFRLVENLGVLPRSVVSKEVKELDQDARGALRKHGVRFGQYTIFQHHMLKPAPTRLRLILWALKEGMDVIPDAPPPGLVTIPAIESAPRGYYSRAGYRLAGERAIRIDMLERLADLIRNNDVKEGFEATPDMLSISGATLEQFADLMGGLGFAAEKGTRAKPVAAPKAQEGDAPETAAETPEPQEAPAEEAAPQEAQPEDVEEVFYTFKWVPRAGQDRGQQRQDQKPRGKKPKRGPKPPTKASARPPKKEKAIDPDNPFAALAALKGNL